MKVYTEVNYIWKDNKLVQTDSKSFDYEGEVEQCHRKRYPHPHVSIPTINEIKETVSEGPTGGTPKDIADALYGGDTEAAVTSVQEGYKDVEGQVNELTDGMVQNTINQVDDEANSLIEETLNSGTNNSLLSESSYGRGESSLSTTGGYKKKTVGPQSRGQMNLTRSSGRSILTS